MPRLDIERQMELEPKRMQYAKEQITALGYTIDKETTTSLTFQYKGFPVTIFPYSGWHSGKTIKDGRGIDNLLKQIEK